MNAPSPIPQKIRTILPSLGSSVDGEALAAARGLGRTLAAAGLDFHDLAAAISVKALTPKPSARQPAPCADHRRSAPPRAPHEFAGYRWREAWAQHHRPRAYTPRQEAQHREQVAYCLSKGGIRLKPTEQAFLRNISELRGNLSYAQAAWLGDITDRLERQDSCERTGRVVP